MMRDCSALTDDILLERLHDNDHAAFEAIFSKYYYGMVFYCRSWIADRTECEDIVQSVFVDLWEQRRHLQVSSLKSYLLKCVRHDCLDAIKHKKVVEAHIAKAMALSEEVRDGHSADKYILYKELEDIIIRTLKNLDPDSVKAFKMSRWEGRKYDEIAEIMNVSRRTIEVRVTKVMRGLRDNILKQFPFLSK